MGRYDSPAALAALVQPHQVHRDIYTDPEVFQQEMKHLFANAWVFVTHPNYDTLRSMMDDIGRTIKMWAS